LEKGVEYANISAAAVPSGDVGFGRFSGRQQKWRNKMKFLMQFVIFSMLTIMAAPAFSATAVQIFRCAEEEGATEEAIEALASNWLKAARSMPGGEDIQAFVYYPLAANLAEGDLLFMIVAPSAAKWGEFWDGYKDSPAEAADAESGGIVSCPDSNLFEGVKVE
jgi:hypothetical protein